ncbi:MAG: glycosyltransferase family 4 protein [Patescibacteria group bacterium]
MKKSLLVTLYFPPLRGGVSKFLWNVCSQLPPDKIVVLTEPSKFEPLADWKIYRRRVLSESVFVWPRWIFLFRKLKAIIEREGIQMIHVGQILPIGTVALILKKRYKIPYLVYVYGQDLVIMRRSFRKMYLIKKILSNASAVITNSSHTQARAITLGSDPRRTITVFPSPEGLVDTYVDQQYLDYIVHKHNFYGKKIILTVGNLVQRKGHDIVLKILPSIIKKIPNLLYVIVGDGPYRTILEELIKKNHLNEYVKIFDRVSDEELPYFYRCSSVFVMPSRALKNSSGEVIDVEGFGMVYLEANLFGKPVIGGKTGGVSDAIKDGQTGLLINPEDPHELSEAILKILSDKEYAHKLGRQGKEHAQNTYVWEREVKKLNKVLA